MDKHSVRLELLKIRHRPDREAKQIIEDVKLFEEFFWYEEKPSVDTVEEKPKKKPGRTSKENGNPSIFD